MRPTRSPVAILPPTRFASCGASTRASPSARASRVAHEPVRTGPRESRPAASLVSLCPSSRHRIGNAGSVQAERRPRSIASTTRFRARARDPAGPDEPRYFSAASLGAVLPRPTSARSPARRRDDGARSRRREDIQPHFWLGWRADMNRPDEAMTPSRGSRSQPHHQEGRRAPLLAQAIAKLAAAVAYSTFTEAHTRACHHSHRARLPTHARDATLVSRVGTRVAAACGDIITDELRVLQREISVTSPRTAHP